MRSFAKPLIIPTNLDIRKRDKQAVPQRPVQHLLPSQPAKRAPRREAEELRQHEKCPVHDQPRRAAAHAVLQHLAGQRRRQRQRAHCCDLLVLHCGGFSVGGARDDAVVVARAAFAVQYIAAAGWALELRAAAGRDVVWAEDVQEVLPDGSPDGVLVDEELREGRGAADADHEEGVVHGVDGDERRGEDGVDDLGGGRRAELRVRGLDGGAEGVEGLGGLEELGGRGLGEGLGGHGVQVVVLDCGCRCWSRG